MKITHALVVKLVDTKDLKSLPFWECCWSPPRAPQMNKIISDINHKSKKFKSFLIKNLKKLKHNMFIVMVVWFYKKNIKKKKQF